VIPISGAKNAALPLMIASMLTKETLTLDNMPLLADVIQLERILSNHGVDYTIAASARRDRRRGPHGSLHAREIVDTTAPYELVSRMRASFWVLAPLLARMREARVSLPGGCAIGTRPVDLLLMAMRSWAPGSASKTAMSSPPPRRLRGAEVDFAKVTVGGTHMALMAASMARAGRCCATPRASRRSSISPTVSSKWAAYSRRASRRWRSKARCAAWRAPCGSAGPHRAGTYAMRAMTGGDVLLAGARADLLQAALDALTQAGAHIEETTKACA